ncbi:MAG: hypothetical protein GXO19_00125 [Epsilonproteobacteria bacterium]|nr:hypothetical protein [Campylobacterota bacterium]NPA56117.1 hypothetical protein [Campylobacterota bacterium]
METTLFKFHSGPILTAELKVALLILGGIALITLFALWYMRFQRRREQYRLFSSMLASRDFEEWEVRRLFNYLHRRHIDLNLILESESVARSAAKGAGLDEEKTLERLGFNTGALIKRFLERQKELRKKWNGR